MLWCCFQAVAPLAAALSPGGGGGGESVIHKARQLRRHSLLLTNAKQAATCFYQLSLPEYGDIFSLAAGLHEALAHAEGFGLA